MIKIAGKIVEENKAQFLVVGDSLSQVASQTIENLSATYKDSSVHILSPLIGMDKREIIPIARKIGTYTISKLPYGDCCSFILAEHPKLNASYGLVKENEDKFDCEKLINEALEKADIKEF
jgi:thiamine biosynthesis protein ThiI